jgi:gluconolactonase
VTGEGDGAADGLKADTEGNIYCTGPGGIHVFDPDGKALGVVKIPEHTANFGFGGQDFCDVFVTASSSLYRFRVKVPGPTPF